MVNALAFGLTLLTAADPATGTQLPIYQDAKAQRRAVSARDLHTALEVKKDFSDWIKQKLKVHRLTANVDFELIAGQKGVYPQKGENLGGRPTTEYLLTLDAAKIIGLGTNNAKGDQLKRYFIWAEKQYFIATPEVDVMNLMPGIEEHLKPAFQRQQSKVLQKFLKEFGGANAVIQHGRTLCETQTGMSARQIVELGKDVGLAPAQRKSAREVMRHLCPAVACAMSLVDTAVYFGAPKDEINLLAAEHQDLFQGLIDCGLAPAETWKGARFIAAA